MSQSYFAADGSYGDALGIKIINTTAWPEWAWDCVDWVRDESKMWAAVEINEYLNTGAVSQDGLLYDFWDYFGYNKLMAAAIRKGN